MSIKPLHQQSIGELAAGLRNGEFSSADLTQHFLARIGQLDPSLNAYRLVCGEQALAEARAADDALRSDSSQGPLHGIPFAVKDLFDVAALPTSAGASFLADNIAKEDAAPVKRLREQGMVLLGKLNTVQLAYGGVGINHDQGTPHNPWHHDPYIPGGSSSGSGVAVAAGLAPVALGSDTGGSVRLPATLCGVTGLKTTVGQISRAGVFPLSWTLDSVGPLTRSAEDAAHLYQAMQGVDHHDPTTSGRPRHDVISNLGDGVRGMRFAFAEGPLFDEAEDEVIRAVRKCGDVFGDLGAEVLPIEFPSAAFVERARSVGVVTAAEAWMGNQRYLQTCPERIDPVVLRRLELGCDVSTADYLQAYREMLNLRKEAAGALEGIDALLVPTAPVCARPVAVVDASLESYFETNSRLLGSTSIGNVLNFCGLSVPCGFSSDRLPIGLLIYGLPFEEQKILRAGYAYQQATDWHRACPDLAWAVAK